MKELSKDEIEKLISEALKTREFAFAHRSEHAIGASVLTDDGDIYGGCNIESVISGMGTCAERAAIDHAICHGDYRILAVCTIDEHYTPPCGACLQYAMLFSQLIEQDIWIVNADTQKNSKIKKLSQLLPNGYKTQNKLKLIRSYR